MTSKNELGILQVSKTTKESKMTITDIIRNEIADALGHTPDKAEQDQFITYIHDEVADKINQDKKVYLVDIEYAIKLCRDEQFKQCEECGEWFLPRDINNIGGNHCLQCKPIQCEDWEPEYE